MNYSSIPTDTKDFYIWLRHHTEKYWTHHRTATFEDFQKARAGGSDWQKDTKWIGGYSEQEIKSVEDVWNINFPPDYRQFLQLLGLPDRPMFSVRYSGNVMVQSEKPSFYDWRKDTEAIKEALEWPLKGILFDVERNDLWLESWGVRPSQPEERQIRLSELIHEAPPLIPIIGHRYLVGTPVESGNPVLSVWQSDIICFGSDFRNFLILELSKLLKIDHTKIFQKATEGITQASLKSIPFWGELLSL